MKHLRLNILLFQYLFICFSVHFLTCHERKKVLVFFVLTYYYTLLVCLLPWTYVCISNPSVSALVSIFSCSYVTEELLVSPGCAWDPQTPGTRSKETHFLSCARSVRAPSLSAGCRWPLSWAPSHSLSTCTKGEPASSQESPSPNTPFLEGMRASPCPSASSSTPRSDLCPPVRLPQRKQRAAFVPLEDSVTGHQLWPATACRTRPLHPTAHEMGFIFIIPSPLPYCLF